MAAFIEAAFGQVAQAFEAKSSLQPETFPKTKINIATLRKLTYPFFAVTLQEINMKDASDAFTVDLLGEVPRRGRKPSPDAKSAAQRMREYRARRRLELQELRKLAERVKGG